MNNDFRKWFKEHYDDLSKEILDLVSIPSVTENRIETRKALDFFLERSRAYGFDVHYEANGDVGIAEMMIDSNKETLGILVHVDVVDPGDPELWSKNPWGFFETDTLWGRGCIDDKGPALICLWAVKSLKDLGIPFKKNIRFIIGTKEETDWKDINEYKKNAQLPNFGFTPDGSFPCTNREKGYCDIVLHFPVEQHNNAGKWNLVSLSGGETINSVPESAFACVKATDGESGIKDLAKILETCPMEEREKIRLAEDDFGNINITVKGKASHSCFPDKGDNAIIRLFGFLGKLGKNKMSDWISTHFGGNCLAESLGLQTRPEMAEGEYIGLTTISPDLLSTKNGNFEIAFNMRNSYGQTREEIRKIFSDQGAITGFSFHIEQFMAAILVPKDRPFMKAMMSAYERRTGTKGEFVLDPGSSYAKAMAGVASFGPVLPDYPDYCHETDERITREEILLLGEIYADAIGSIVSSDESFA